MRKGRGYRDHWQFHFNDWMDNGTFHHYEEDMERVPEPKEDQPAPAPQNQVWSKPNGRSSFMTTGRFDQFNEEFDCNFNLHSCDCGERDQVQDDEKPSGTSGVDEYRDDDPYKISGSNNS